MYRIWRYDLGHYQAYSCGTEIVELGSRKCVKEYIEKHLKDKSNFRIDWISSLTKEIRREV